MAIESGDLDLWGDTSALDVDGSGTSGGYIGTNPGVSSPGDFGDGESSLQLDGLIFLEADGGRPFLDVFTRMTVGASVVSGSETAGGDLELPGLSLTAAAVAGAAANGSGIRLGLGLSAAMAAAGGTLDDLALSLDLTGSISSSGSDAVGFLPMRGLLGLTGSMASAAAAAAGQIVLPHPGLSGSVLTGGSAATGYLALPPIAASGLVLVGGLAGGTVVVPPPSASGAIYAVVTTSSGTLVLPLPVLDASAYASSDASSGGSAGAGSATVAGGLTLADAALALNLANRAPTLYSNFPFNSYAVIGGRVFAAAAGGIYELTGTLDDGVAIDAIVTFNLTDAGTPDLKRLVQAYVGYRTDGELELRVATDGDGWYTYLLSPTRVTGIYRNRVKIGKGFKASYIQFEIRNRGGADFIIDAIDAEGHALERRGSR